MEGSRSQEWLQEAHPGSTSERVLEESDEASEKAVLGGVAGHGGGRGEEVAE